jgi:hypothetical protein
MQYCPSNMGSGDLDHIKFEVVQCERLVLKTQTIFSVIAITLAQFPVNVSV